MCSIRFVFGLGLAVIVMGLTGCDKPNDPREFMAGTWDCDGSDAEHYRLVASNQGAYTLTWIWTGAMGKVEWGGTYSVLDNGYGHRAVEWRGSPGPLSRRHRIAGLFEGSKSIGLTESNGDHPLVCMQTEAPKV